MYGVIGINFVDHFLNQGAPAEHKSAETPIGHESLNSTDNILWHMEWYFEVTTLTDKATKVHTTPSTSLT